MGKKKSNAKESENGNPVTKLSESPVKNSDNSGRPKASFVASLFFIFLIGILGIILGLIFIEIDSSNKDIKNRILKHDSVEKETVPLHVKDPKLKANDSLETPIPTPPVISEPKEKMDDKNKRRSSTTDGGSISEPSAKKQKLEETVVKEEKKIPDVDTLDKQKDIESQILKDSPEESRKDKEKQRQEKEETLKSSSAKDKPKDDQAKKDSSAMKPEEKKSEATLKELYIEVESLAEDILQEDPENSMVKELAPHLEGVLRDLEGGKLSGLRDSLLHIKIILSDLKERLEAAKSQKESDVSKHPSRVPVDEVIPDPIYIAPLGDKDKDPSHKIVKKSINVEKDSQGERKVTEKSQETPKTPSKSEKLEPQPSSTEKVMESDTKKSKTEDSVKVPKEKLATIKESEKLKDKIVDEKLSRKEVKNTVDKASNVEDESRKSSVESSKKENPTEKVPPENIKLDTKSPDVGKEKQATDKTNIDAKQPKKLGEKDELKEPQKVEATTSQKQPSKEPLPQQEPAVKDKESNKNFKKVDLTSDKKAEDKRKEEAIVKNIDKNTPKVQDIKTDTKDSKSASLTKESISKEKNIRSSAKETQTAEKHNVPVSGKPKQTESREDVTSVPTSSDEKIIAKPLENKAETKSSDIDEKLELASALEEENLLQALSVYDSLLQMSPKSPTVLYRRALVIDKLSQEEKSNARLEQAIQAYLHLLEFSIELNIPKDMLKDAGLKCADRLNFRGSAMFPEQRKLLRFLTTQFYDDSLTLNKIGIFYLLMNRNKEAEVVFKRVLEIAPEDGFAQVHYGFVRKLESNERDSMIEAADFMDRGLKSNAEGVHDVRMYYQLGDAYLRLNQSDKAYEIFDQAVERGLLKSRYQRSTHDINRLTAKPIWLPEETPYEETLKKIQSHWKEIRREGVLALNISYDPNTKAGYRDDREKLRETGVWKQYELFGRGKKHIENCKITPVTCSLIEEFKPAAECKVGQTKFSVMAPGTHVYPHSGPTNCRLRSHLGLVTPEGARIRVINETLTWEEGKLFIFDDSFEHEVWHDGTIIRLILIVDVWHPEITEQEKKTLTPL